MFVISGPVASLYFIAIESILNLTSRHTKSQCKMLTKGSISWEDIRDSLERVEPRQTGE